ncbi:hypothetical protein A3K73_00090 [Candidatus Pacearchaeota archaeon RBG_13_36_9]|nr:MAG: hypothetical protein A3K73_00090 [Candidatus Pacearchaeota archaeon RBG_13_36_9]
MNKKGDQQMATGKIITALLVVLVIVVLLFFLISSDMRGVIYNLLPDFITGRTPVNLTVEAVVINTNVLVLINDGEGRCIIDKVIQSQENNDLTNYGLRENQLIQRSGSNEKDWNPVKISYQGNFVDRVTNYMQLPENKKLEDVTIRLQRIEQDLFVACSTDAKDFKSATIQGSQVTLLKEDEFKRCLIYESKAKPILEHYSIDKKLIGGSKLYKLSIAGQWGFVEILTTEQKEEIALVQELEELKPLSRDFALYFAGFNVDLCKAKDTDVCDPPEDNIRNINTYLIELAKPDSDAGLLLAEIRDIANKKNSDSEEWGIYFTNILEGVNKKSFRAVETTYAEKQNLDEGFHLCDNGRCYVRKGVDGKTYYYSGGKYYTTINPKSEFKSPYLGMTDKERLALLNLETIKSDLEKEC